MIMHELKSFLSFGMMGSSWPLQHRRMISVASTGSARLHMAPENIVDIIDIYVVIHDDDISGKFTQTDDLKVIDETYDFYAPYWVTSLALRPEQFQKAFSPHAVFPSRLSCVLSGPPSRCSCLTDTQR